MDTFHKPPSPQNNIIFTISADGEIRSLNSPQPSPLKKRTPQQNLRRVRFESRPHEHQDTPSTASESSLSKVLGDTGLTSLLHTPTTLRKSEPPPRKLDRYSINAAIQIARSEYIQIGLQRRYWDPPLLPTHHEPASYHLAVGSDSISRVVALTDIKISGDPIRLCTPDFQVEPRGLKVGACLFLNLPYGANDACGLQVRMKDGSATDQPKFILEVCAAVLDARNGRKMWRLCTQHDVTDIINEIARKRSASGPTASTLSETSSNPDPRRPHSKTFDWTAFTEDELESQQHNRSNAASTTPRHPRTTRLSGSTLVSSAGSSARSTLIATTPTQQHHHPQQGLLPTAPPAATAPITSSPPPVQGPPAAASLFATIPADVHAFLHLAQAVRRAHASRFFILVPRQQHCYRNRRRFEKANGDEKPILTLLGCYAISFISAELYENGGELHKVVGALERQAEVDAEEVRGDGSSRRAIRRALAAGLKGRETFVWDVSDIFDDKRRPEKLRAGGRHRAGGAKGEDAEGRRRQPWKSVECVPVGDGRGQEGERWWVCFVR